MLDSVIGELMYLLNMPLTQYGWSSSSRLEKSLALMCAATMGYITPKLVYMQKWKLLVFLYIFLFIFLFLLQGAVSVLLYIVHEFCFVCVYI